VSAIHANLSDEASDGWKALTKAWGPSRTAILEAIGIAAYKTVKSGGSLRDNDWFPNLTTIMFSALDINSDRRTRQQPLDDQIEPANQNQRISST